MWGKSGLGIYRVSTSSTRSEMQMRACYTHSRNHSGQRVLRKAMQVHYEQLSLASRMALAKITGML